MKAGIEKIFLEYANLPLEGKPENLIKVLDVAEEFFQLPHKETVSKVFEYMAIIEKCHFIDSDDWYKVREELLQKARSDNYFNSPECYDAHDMVKVVFNALYPERCSCITIPSEQIWEKFNLNDPKCYLCSQSLFKHFLSSIVKGIEYSSLMNDSFIANDVDDDPFSWPYSTQFFGNETNYSLQSKINIIQVENDPTFKDKLERKWIWDIYPADFANLNDDIINMVGTSLFEFLLNDDQNRKKLKKCYKCYEFYVQGKLNPKQKYCPKCSPKSKMSKEERREYQKNWRKKKKDEKIKKESEEKIENYINNLGCTREEAEKIIEADSKL